MIMGHSQGTVHAMAAAYCYPIRCEGFGLNAPLLPSKISKEVGVVVAIGSDSLPNTETIQKLYMAWYFGLMHLSLVTFSPWLPLFFPGYFFLALLFFLQIFFYFLLLLL